jgi:hypothetical protein
MSAVAPGTSTNSTGLPASVTIRQTFKPKKYSFLLAQ